MSPGIPYCNDARCDLCEGAAHKAPCACVRNSYSYLCPTPECHTTAARSKQKKLLKQLDKDGRLPKELSLKVDLKKVNWPVSAASVCVFLPHTQCGHIGSCHSAGSLATA